VINEGYGVDFPEKQLDKVKEAAKELKDVTDKAKDDKDPKIAEATTQLQDAIINVTTELISTWTICISIYIFTSVTICCPTSMRCIVNWFLNCIL
jgi:hypothetical protein